MLFNYFPRSFDHFPICVEQLLFQFTNHQYKLDRIFIYFMPEQSVFGIMGVPLFWLKKLVISMVPDNKGQTHNTKHLLQTVLPCHYVTFLFYFLFIIEYPKYCVFTLYLMPFQICPFSLQLFCKLFLCFSSTHGTNDSTWLLF